MKTTINNVVKSLFLGVLISTTNVWTFIHAQESSAEEGSTIFEEIIVTAQKREQSVLDVPFAISAFGEDEIKARGAADIKDMQYAIPGLFITNNQPGQDRVQIRGASAGTGLGYPTVGRYMDEVSVSSDATQRALDIPLLDIQRVEVLRGPQGTLYGAGSIGGTIKFISNSPDLKEASRSLGIGFNSIDDGSEGHELNGVFNMPIIEDKLALRIAASTEDIGGWIDNTTTGETDINEAGRDFIRAKLLFKPNENLTASLMWMHYDFEQDNNNHEISESGFNLLNVDDRRATNERTVSRPFETPVSDEWDLVNLIINYETESANIISSTGYLDRSIDFVSEFVNAFFPPEAYGSFGIEDRDAETFTQEIRVSSNGDNPLNYTVGVFYRETDTSEIQTLCYPSFFGFPCSVTTGTAPVDSKSWALFGELSYDISDRFMASFGARIFNEDQEPSTFQLGGPAPMDVSADDQSFEAFTPRLNLLWKVSENASLYATLSNGFRSGGINGFGSSIPDFEPEEAKLAEIGGRGEFGNFYLEGSYYYMDIDDVQVSVIDGVYARTTNVGSASGPGVDLAVGVNITDDLTLNLTGGYIDRTYDEIDDSKPSNVIEGDMSQYTPKFTGSASLSYDFNWTDKLAGTARLDLSRAREYSVYIRTFPGQPVIYTQPLTYLSFRMGVIADSWQVVLSADNLLDEKDQIFPGGAFSLDTYSRPRTVSVKMNYNF